MLLDRAGGAGDGYAASPPPTFKMRKSRFFLLSLSGADPAYELVAGQELLIGRNHSKVLLPNRHISRQQASFKVLEEPGTARQLIIVTNVRAPRPICAALALRAPLPARCPCVRPRPRAHSPATPRPHVCAFFPTQPPGSWARTPRA